MRRLKSTLIFMIAVCILFGCTGEKEPAAPDVPAQVNETGGAVGEVREPIGLAGRSHADPRGDTGRRRDRAAHCGGHS